MESKKIAIDARLFGTKHTGIGRYTQNLVKQVIKLLPPHIQLYLIIHPQDKTYIEKIISPQVKLITTSIPHYSLREQLFLPILLYKHNFNLVHFTHFNKPLFYLRPSVITIHDLIKHYFRGEDTTTHNHIFYWLKYISYYVLVFLNIKLNYLIVPSNYWNKKIQQDFNVNPKKIITTYEAVDDQLKTTSPPVTQPDSYLLYTGNLYPHKNIFTLLKALSFLPDLKLLIIGKHNIFTQRTQKLVRDLHLEAQVNFMGYLEDKDFIKLYMHAYALVHPSLMEGFSLTGLEAMSLNCPVVAANSSCLPEIYGNAALYFKPTSPSDLVTQLTKLKDTETRQNLIVLGKKQVAKYSWLQTARQTLDFYTTILNA